RRSGCYVRAAAVRYPAIHRVLLAGVEVIEPCREEAAAAELAPVLVQDDVVRVVLSGPAVAEGTDEVPLEPSRRLHSNESPAVRHVREDLVDDLLIERLLRAEVALVRQPGSELEQRRPEVHDLLA